MILKEFITKWGFQVDDKALHQLDKNLAKVRSHADAAGKTATRALAAPVGPLDQIQGAALSARNAVLGLVTAFAAGGFGLGAFFKTIGNFEQTEIAFDVLIGDAEKAKKTFADLKQFAKSTPFNFGDVADLSKRLLAFSFSAEELIPTMTALGNIAAGVGREKLPQLILALGQVKAAGRLRGSELRQFTEAGVPLIAELAKTLGVADSKVQDMVESGKVGFKEVYKALENVTGEGGRFNNLMARQSQSLLGIFSNLIDTVQLLAVDLGNRGLLGRSKVFMRNMLSILETNREKILVGTQHAIDLIVIGLEHIITLAKGVWQVFHGLMHVLGGTRKGIELLLKGLLFVTAGRMLFLLGKMAIGVGGLARAFVTLGNSALLAQIKIFAFAAGIGALLVGVALIIEDIVGYFQGRNSITGIILKDLGQLGEKFEEYLKPILDKVMAFGKSVGRSIVDGISSLTQADWGQFGNALMAMLEVVFLASTIPLRIGLAIAEGVIQGIADGIKTRFPMLMPLVDLMSGDASNVNQNIPMPNFKPKDGSFFELMKGMITLGSGDKAPIYKDASGIVSPAATGPQPIFNIQADVNVSVPPGTPPESIGAAVTDGVSQGVQGVIRETSRATKGAIAY